MATRKTPPWRVPTDPVEWMETHFYIEDPRDPQTADLLSPGPIRLFPHQRRIIRAALQRDEKGAFRWQTILYSCPKKSGKTRIAAAVVQWVASQYGPWAECYVLGNDGKQSEDRLLAAINKSVALSPIFADWKLQRRQTTVPDGSFIEAIPVDPSGESGSNPTISAWSELWGYGLEHKERFWATMTISPARSGRSIRWVETYAGYTGESPTLERLYEQGVTMGARHPDFPDLPVYVNEGAQLFCYWDEEPRMPWQTAQYYAQEARLLPPNEFLRLHRNQWVSALNTFVPEEWWMACQEDLPPLEPREGIILGIDAAVSGACFGVVGVTRHPDPARRKTDVAVRYAKKWAPPKGGKIQFYGKDSPDEEIRRLCKEYKVLMVVYDLYQLHGMAEQHRKERVAHWEQFSQQTDRMVADSLLFQLIRERQIAHGGDPDLKQHILNASSKTSTDQDTKMRLVQRSSNLPIDLAVATSMAAKRCLELRM